LETNDTPEEENNIDFCK